MEERLDILLVTAGEKGQRIYRKDQIYVRKTKRVYEKDYRCLERIQHKKVDSNLMQGIL